MEYNISNGNDTWKTKRRPNKWHIRYLELARHISCWSRDPSTKVGAVIVRPNKSVCSVGFNGFAQGVKDLKERYDDRDIKYGNIIHAEMNAKDFAREPLDNYTLYTYPFMPCKSCAGPIINSGIKKVVSIISNNPRWDFTWSMIQFNEANIKVMLYDECVLERNGLYSSMIQNISVSAELNRTPVLELGRQSPYIKNVKFPIEETSLSKNNS